MTKIAILFLYFFIYFVKGSATENVPIQDVPIQDVPIQDVPIQDVPIQDVPIQELLININQTDFYYGMFSVFSYVCGVLYFYDIADYAGLKIDFEKKGLYYDKNFGENWWEYYCQPINFQKREPKQIKTFSSEEYHYYAYYLQDNLSREEVNYLIKKYIKLQQHVQNKIDSYITLNFKQSHVIGVHYRGTDKYLDSPEVDYEKVIIEIQDYIKANKLTNYKIFIATDEEAFYEYILEIFPNLVITYSSMRSIDSTPIHETYKNTYEHGEEAIIDSILLSRCNVLIKTSSNLSLWSTYFNPALPVIALSELAKK